MTQNSIIIMSQPSVYRRQPLLSNAKSSSSSSSSSSTGSQRFAEVAGGMAAECAAICCCCPCGIVDLLVLAIYKVPAGLCRKAMRSRKRRRLIKEGLIPLPSKNKRRCEGREVYGHPKAMPEMEEEVLVVGREVAKELMEMEEEMLDRFYSTGFWRSPSQRERERESPTDNHSR